MKINEIFEKQKHNTVNIIVVIVAVFIAFKLYNGNMNGLPALQQQIRSGNEVISLLDQLNAVSKKSKVLDNAVNNNRDQSAILQSLGDMAKDFSIEIISVKPEPERKFGFYVFRQFSLNLKCKNYHDLGNFISKVEVSPDIFMIDKLNLNLVSSGNPRTNTVEKYLEVGLIVGTISIP